MYSFWSNMPAGETLEMKLRRVSAARRASSCVGELGEDPIGVPEMAAPPVAEVVDLPPKLLLLLTRRSVGEVIPVVVVEVAESMPKECAPISWAGDSSAEDGAVPVLLLYLGVRDSPLLFEPLIPLLLPPSPPPLLLLG